jgi:hypothetical protein
MLTISPDGESIIGRHAPFLLAYPEGETPDAIVDRIARLPRDKGVNWIHATNILKPAGLQNWGLIPNPEGWKPADSQVGLEASYKPSIAEAMRVLKGGNAYECSTAPAKVIAGKE